MKRNSSALSRAHAFALACTTAILSISTFASANGDAQLGPIGFAEPMPEAGLTIAIGGAGLNQPPDLREGTITIDIGGGFFHSPVLIGRERRRGKKEISGGAG